jgi:hypothetical protein
MAGESLISASNPLLRYLNIFVALVVTLLITVIYWLWMEGDIGNLSESTVRRVQEEAFLFRVMWALIVGVFGGGVTWVILESVRPTRE